MYLRVEVSSNVRIEFIVVAITMMLHLLPAESAGHFWQPVEIESLANLDFEHLKHLQNPGHLPLIKSGMYDVLMYCTTYLQITIEIIANKMSTFLLIVLLILNE